MHRLGFRWRGGGARVPAVCGLGADQADIQAGSVIVILDGVIFIDARQLDDRYQFDQVHRQIKHCTAMSIGLN